MIHHVVGNMVKEEGCLPAGSDCMSCVPRGLMSKELPTCWAFSLSKDRAFMSPALGTCWAVQLSKELGIDGVWATVNAARGRKRLLPRPSRCSEECRTTSL